MGTMPQNNRFKPKHSADTHPGTETSMGQCTEMSSTDRPCCPFRRSGRQWEGSEKAVGRQWEGSGKAAGPCRGPGSGLRSNSSGTAH